MESRKSVPACVRRALAESFGLDLRSLFLLRLVIALMIWVDLWIRLQTLTAHYTDAGVLPRALNQSLFLARHPGRFSLHMLSGEAWAQLLLFAFLGLAALLVALGYRTRLSLWVVWLLTISLHNRNDMVLTGGDHFLRVALFWSLWLPLSGLFSLDARAGRVAKPARPLVASLTTFAFTLQLCCVYWFSVAHKTHARWRSDFSAVHYALHLESLATDFGIWLRQFQALTRVLTFFVFYTELVAPFLLFGVGLLSLLPRLSGLLRFQPLGRTVGVFAFMGLHAGLGLGLALGTFSWFVMLVWIAFLPGAFWDFLERQRQRFGARLSWFRTFASPVWAPNDTVPSSWARFAERGRQAAAVSALLLVLGINLRTLDAGRLGAIDGPVRSGMAHFDPLISALRIDQHWGLFAPKPRGNDGWFVLRAVQENGKEVDLLHPDAPLSFDASELGSSAYPTFRWRKYYRDLRRDRARSKQARPAYLAYWCRVWNGEHTGDSRIETLELVFMHRKTKRSGGYGPVKQVSVAQGHCATLGAEWGQPAIAQTRCASGDPDCNDSAEPED